MKFSLDADLYTDIIHKLPVYGLEYVPWLVNEVDNLSDPPLFSIADRPVQDFSVDNLRVLKEELLRLRPRTILEIGVNVDRKNLDKSSTGVLLANKIRSALYIGVDMVDKSYLAVDGSIQLVKGDSADSRPVQGILVGRQLDLIVIDGYHSVKQVLADWQYVQWLSGAGTVVMHDVNVHPGPYLVFNAIDRKMFDCVKYGSWTGDWGIGIARSNKDWRLDEMFI